MKVKSESEVAQLCPTLSDPMDCSLRGSSVHGIFQATVVEWDAIAFSAFPTNSLQKLNLFSWPSCTYYFLPETLLNKIMAHFHLVFHN